MALRMIQFWLSGQIIHVLSKYSTGLSKHSPSTISPNSQYQTGITAYFPCHYTNNSLPLYHNAHCSAAVSSAVDGRHTLCSTAAVRAADGRRTVSFIG